MKVEKFIPRGMQQEAGDLLRQRQRGLFGSMVDAASVAVWAYLVQFAAAFNHYSSIAEAVVLVVTFAFAPHNPGLFALLLVLVALGFRNAYTHRKDVTPELQYYLDSAGDAATAGVFLLASQGLAAIAAPSMALPSQILYRSMLVCLPLIAMVRMVLRSRPEGTEPPLDHVMLPAKKLYRRMRMLNFLWLMTFYGVIAQGVTDKHGYWPDFVRGLLPIVTFGVWIATQADDLCRRDNLLTLFANVKEKALRQMASRLPKGVKRTDVNYSSFILLQVLMFALMALALLGAIEPFLLGQPLEQSVWHAIGGMLAFGASAISWKYVKAANRAAVREIVRQAAKHD